jgi:MarR family transcriptional regulator for hemolysin
MATVSEPRTSTDLMMLLSQAGHALACELTAALEAIGVSPRAHCVLTTALTGDLTQGRLAELCQLDKTTMVVTIDELERAGLAERRPSKTDRRARIIAVTPKGERIVEAARRIVAEVYEDVLGTLPAREREALLDGLAALVGEGGRLARPAQCERTVRRPRAAGTAPAAAAPQ